MTNHKWYYRGQGHFSIISLLIRPDRGFLPYPETKYETQHQLFFGMEASNDKWWAQDFLAAKHTPLVRKVMKPPRTQINGFDKHILEEENPNPRWCTFSYFRPPQYKRSTTRNLSDSADCFFHKWVLVGNDQETRKMTRPKNTITRRKYVSAVPVFFCPLSRPLWVRKNWVRNCQEGPNTHFWRGSFSPELKRG